jgi:hypothetical protein
MENGMSVRQTIFVTIELRVRRRTENPLIPLPSSEFDDPIAIVSLKYDK